MNEAHGEYDDLRIVVMLRNIAKLEFLLMEHEAHRYTPSDYVWGLKSGRNFIGRDAATGVHRFTWQSSGSQFTIHHAIPASARRFRIVRQPPIVGEQAVLDSISFDESWIQTV